MVRTIYIHIGTYKTGSSSIQRALSDHASDLAKAGYQYPQNGRVNPFAHNNIAYEFLASPFLVPEKGFLADVLREYERSGLPNLLLSSEDFFWLQKSHIDALVTQLPDDARKQVIVYLRRQDELLQSAAVQDFKNMHWRGPIDDWPNRIGNDYRGNYSTHLQPWADAVDEIHVRTFETSQFAGGDLVSDFLQIVGLGTLRGTLPVGTDENKSPGHKTIALIQALYDCFADHPTGTPTDEYLLELVQQILIQGAVIFTDEIKYNTITVEIFEQFAEMFHESNQMVAQMYLNRAKLFTEPFVNKPLTPSTEVNLGNDEILRTLITSGYQSKFVLSSEVINDPVFMANYFSFRSILRILLQKLRRAVTRR